MGGPGEPGDLLAHETPRWPNGCRHTPAGHHGICVPERRGNLRPPGQPHLAVRARRRDRRYIPSRHRKEVHYPYVLAIEDDRRYADLIQRARPRRRRRTRQHRQQRPGAPAWSVLDAFLCGSWVRHQPHVSGSRRPPLENMSSRRPRPAVTAGRPDCPPGRRPVEQGATVTRPTSLTCPDVPGSIP